MMTGYRFQQFGFAVGVISLAFAWYGLMTGNDALVSNTITISLSGLIIHLIGHSLNR